MKRIVALIVTVAVAAMAIIGYSVLYEVLEPGYVGYIYDRSAGAEDNVIPGTSVINEQRTGRILLNPITQSILDYPTSKISVSFTGPDENDWNGKDMSITVVTSDGKKVDMDVYLELQFVDIPKVIQSFSTKKYENIVDENVYAITRGRLNSLSQEVSVYDIQTELEDMRTAAEKTIGDELLSSYGIELCYLELGAPNLPEDIQQKIQEKTNAINAVELAKLERQKQDEINQQIVDEQKAQSEKERIQREAEADAAAYERERAAEAELSVAQAQVEIAKQQVEVAKLEKEAALEAQKAYTENYFRDKELDVQREAVQAINPSVKTIITDGDGFSGLVGIKEILNAIQ